MTDRTADTVPESVQAELKDFSPLLQQLFFNRGITTKAAAQGFLNPIYEDLADPFAMANMDRAVARILEAIKSDQTIVIYADYDADGIPGAVVLHDFFNKIGFGNFSVYLPHRHNEGYGFHKHAIDQFADANVDLIITIDLGVTAVDTVDYANQKGIDVIITDHHEPDEVLPAAVAIVNPKLGDYPDPMLCGAATIWQVVRGLIAKGDFELVEGWEKWLLDMVGLATLSDMVPLVNENRILASYGLKVLQKSRRPGLRALLAKNKVPQNNLTGDDIVFSITPKLNAASRLAHPEDAFLVLSSTDPVEAEAASDHLMGLNTRRKTLVAQTMKKVHKKLTSRELREVIVVGDPDWNVGILSILSTKIAEEYQRPTFVWAAKPDGEGILKGSCRAYGSVSVVTMMRSLPDGTLEKFGGHTAAGGFSATKEHIHFLEDRLIEALDSSTSKEPAEENFIDAELSLDLVNQKTLQDISQLAPFGKGNQKPLFRLTNYTVVEEKLFGKHKDHLSLTLQSSTGRTIRAVKFFATEIADKNNLVGEISYSRFSRKVEVLLR